MDAEFTMGNIEDRKEGDNDNRIVCTQWKGVSYGVHKDLHTIITEIRKAGGAINARLCYFWLIGILENEKLRTETIENRQFERKFPKMGWMIG